MLSITEATHYKQALGRFAHHYCFALDKESGNWSPLQPSSLQFLSMVLEDKL